jgi:hypothetical protein
MGSQASRPRLKMASTLLRVGAPIASARRQAASNRVWSYPFALRISAMHDRYALSGSRRPSKICSTSAPADGPMDAAQEMIRDGGQAPYSRCERGRCSAIVLAEPFGPHNRAWLATR